jgi:DNA-binding MarR family transcriptional regulator
LQRQQSGDAVTLAGVDGSLNEDQLAAWRAFIGAHAAVLTILERELEAEHGMSLAVYDVLAQLSEAPEGRLRMSELADAVVVSRSGLTRLVDRMEQAGHVRRESCPSDRRGAFAVITPAGRAALRRAWPVHARGVRDHFAGQLTHEEARTLAAALTRVGDAARSGRRGGRPTARPNRS